MNNYRVHCAADDFTAHVIHVSARTREEAVYKTFDEMTDRGMQVIRFAEVWIQEGNTWSLTRYRTTVNA